MKFTAPKRYGSAKSDVWLVEFGPEDFPVRAAISQQVDAFDYALTGDYTGTSTSPFLIGASTAGAKSMLHLLDTHEVRVAAKVTSPQFRELIAVGERFGFESQSWQRFARQVRALALAPFSELDRLYYAAYLFAVLEQIDITSGNVVLGVIRELGLLNRSMILTRAQLEAIVACLDHLIAVDPKALGGTELLAQLTAQFKPGEIDELVAAGLNAHKLGRAAAIRGEMGYAAPVSELVEMVTTMPDSWFANLLLEV